jgi:hypothetical protein
MSAYSAAVLADSPVSYWRLDEPSGAIAADQQGANAGTYKGTVTLGQTGALTQSGDLDASVSLDGATGYVSIPDSAGLRLGTGQSVECWIKPTSGDLSAGFVALVVKGNWATGANTAFQFYLQSGALGFATGAAAAAVGASLIAGVWQHCVVTWDGATVTYYLNGVPSSVSYSQAQGNSTGWPLAIGAGTTSLVPALANLYAGPFDEVAVYSHVLSAARVAAHYQAGVAAPGGAGIRIYDRPRLQVQLDGRDVSERCDQIVFSATDSGGYEISTLDLPAPDRARRGAPIVIRSGLETAWSGRVAEVSDHNEDNDASKSLGGEGLVALCRDAVYSQVYVDRALSGWGDPSLTRQVAMLTANQQLGASQVGSDPTSLTPALVQSITDSWASPWTPANESLYDAGPGNLVAKIYYALVVSEGAVGTWLEQLLLSADANLSMTQASGNLHSSAPVSAYFSPSSARRFAAIQHQNTVTSAGVQGATYNAYWESLALYGPHGLTPRGPDPGGFYPSDIARHALTQVPGVSAGTILDSIGYIAPHVVYRIPVPADQILGDMAQLMGWTWGVWEPSTIFGMLPRLDFRPPPTDATAVISRAECDQLDITARLGDLYDVCEVTFTDAAGTAGIATAALPNPALAEAGIATRTLQLDMGLATQASATVFAAFALALSMVAARAAGTATLPTSVRLVGGGSKPACLLRPGIDRLRITDLPDAGNLFDVGTDRRDVFRISRIESTAAQDGTVSSVAELDNGANLLETLQARLAIAASVVGSGAS